MKKIIAIVISTITIISFSCGTQKGSPSTSSSMDSTQVSTDSVKPGK